MASITIPESQQCVVENTIIKDRGDEQALSTKAHEGSTSFLDSFSPWSTRSHLISDRAIHRTDEEAKTCTLLVEEVFRPQQAQKGERVADKSFLPTLLSRVNFSMWPQTPSKHLSGEIQLLKGQQGAAAKLLEEIEKEADHINHRLKEKSQQAKASKFQGNRGLFGSTCKTCSQVSDSEEINLQTPRTIGDHTLELRPMLRNRIKDCEQSIVERDAELRQLRQEIQLLRSEKELMRQDETDAVLDGPRNAKEALLKRYAAVFCAADASQLKVAFLAWHQHGQQRALRKRILKHSSLALTSQSDQLKALLFASWQTLVREKRQAQKLKEERKRLTIGQSYAAKFAMQTNSSTMRSIFIGWWRVSKESALRAHVAAVQQKEGATTALVPVQKQGVPADKACCILM